jgi:hypothetical protein
VWNQQTQFYQKTENLQLFYGRAGAKQTMFNKSEMIKFEAESKRWNSRLTLQPSKQQKVGSFPRANEASGQPSCWACEGQSYSILGASKHWQPRQTAKMKIKMKQTPNRFIFSTIRFQHVSDRHECDEEVKDAPTC